MTTTFPRYRSHKVVEAAKVEDITRLTDPPGAAVLVLDSNGFSVEHSVPAAYVTKHDPQIGGYWVRYPDSYESWSPAEAFEGGYTRVDEAP